MHNFTTLSGETKRHFDPSMLPEGAIAVLTSVAPTLAEVIIIRYLPWYGRDFECQWLSIHKAKLHAELGLSYKYKR